MIVLALLVVAAVVFQIWVTVRVSKSDLYERSEKLAQAKLIWLVPVLGAVIVFSVLQSEDQNHKGPPRSHWRG
jgi:hypothetical protein